MEQNEIKYNLIKSKIDRLIKEGHSPKAVYGGIEIGNIVIGRKISIDKDFYPLTICGDNLDYSLSNKSREDLYWYLKNMMPSVDTYLNDVNLGNEQILPPPPPPPTPDQTKSI